MSICWRADGGPTLNVAGLVACDFTGGSGPVLLKKLLYFCDFSGGPRPPTPSESAHGMGATTNN